MSKKEPKLTELLDWANRDQKKKNISGSWLWKAGFTFALIIIVVVIIYYLTRSKKGSPTDNSIDRVKKISNQTETIIYKDTNGEILSPTQIGSGKYVEVKS